MEKRPSPQPPPGKKAPNPADANTAMESTDPDSGGNLFATTEEFTMPPPNEDDAADFLLDDENAAAAKPPKKSRPRELDDTVMHDPANVPPQPKMEETIPHEDSSPPPAKPSAKPAVKPPAAGLAKTKEILMGDYRLTKKLGQGGMGGVFLGHQLSLDRPVALKVLSKELAAKEAFVGRFQREAQVMAKLDHPNILRCYGVGAIGGITIWPWNMSKAAASRIG
jgi:hypothetical protein